MAPETPAADGSEVTDVLVALDRQSLELLEALTELIETPVDRLPAAIEAVLATVGSLTDIDRIGVSSIDRARRTMDLELQWHSERVPPDFDAAASLSLDRFPRMVAQLDSQQMMVNDDTDALGGTLLIDKEALLARGIRANVSIPLVRGGVVSGILFVDYLGGPRAWAPLLPTFRVVGHAVAAAFGRLEDQRRLRRSEQRFRLLFDNNPLPVFVVDADSLYILDANEAAQTVYGRIDALAETSFAALHADTERSRIGELVASARAGFIRSGPWTHIAGAGATISVELAASLVELEDAEALLVVVHDVTEQRNLERQLRHRAFHDELTGLATRALFEDRVNHAISSRSFDPASLAVILLDLDGFKAVNDSLGHAAGDALLVEAARRIEGAAREHDTVARLGGDEFVLMLTGEGAADGARGIAERIADVLAEPFDLDGYQVVLSASFGIAVVSESAPTADVLLRDADLAMYAAKERGAGGIEEYASGLGEIARDRFELLADLHRAVAEGELRLHYQPTVDLSTDTIRSVEALLRWNHPVHGLLLPGRFLHHIESTPLADRVGDWVVDEVCRQIRVWTDEFGSSPPVAINIAARQLAGDDLVQSIVMALGRHDVPPELLILELTERSLVETDDVLARLETLRSLGLKLAIDDFGTGYSALSRLRRLPIDVIKIDRSFITELGVDTSRATAVVATIVELAHTLGMEIVAEGVEEASQQSVLKQIGCDTAQGFLFARPQPAAELALFIAAVSR